MTKLVGTPYLDQYPKQGVSVSLSSDGLTLAVGSPFDNDYIGATWIFKKTGSTWNQVTKLVGTGYVGSFTNQVQQGSSVSLSSDGLALAVGGSGDDDSIGATWIFKSTSGTWNQVTKLVGTGYVGASASQGCSVSLSSDGLTLAVGGYGANNSIGATWIFKNTSGTWNQVTKLVGTGYVGPKVYQGSSVSLSSDGLTLAVGGWGDDNYMGATWIFKNTGGTWNQVPNLVGTDGAFALQGYSVSLSSDGLTLAMGGYGANDSTGVTWIFNSTGGA